MKSVPTSPDDKNIKRKGGGKKKKNTASFKCDSAVELIVSGSV